MTHHTYHDVYDGDGGQMQTADEAMGILGGQRVSNMHRDDVRNHLIACETYGYLNETEARLRKDAAYKARTEGELFHVVRDLPDETKLATLGARKRLTVRAGGRVGRLFKWLLTTKPGRGLFHPAIAVMALMLAVIPMAVLAGPHDIYSTPAAVFAISAGIVGFVAFIVDVVFGVCWFVDNNG